MAEYDAILVAKWLGCRCPDRKKILGFKQNSRDILPGDLFFAMPGERTDGHAYLEEAAFKGAIGAVVSREYQGKDFGLTLFRVPQVIEALHDLAKIVHSLRKTRVIGVTGSVGKTTTKEFIATLLLEAFRVGKTPGNANSQVGVPLSILNARGDEEVFVLEMGMSLPHQIERLITIAPPEIAVVTKIALSHVAFFPDGLEGIAAAKAEILSHPSTRLGIVNEQVASFSVIGRSNCPKMTYGDAEKNDFVLVREADLFCIYEKGQRSPFFSLPFSASHLCENFLASAAVARAMGMDWLEIISGAQKLQGFQRRFERVEREGIVFINDAYNANPTSMMAALMNLPPPKPGKKRIAVLGAMAELGVYSESSHLTVAHAASERVDYLLCLGTEWTPMKEVFAAAGKPVEFFEDLHLLKQRVFAVAEEGDVVLLKGSNGKKLWMVLE